jgi:arylformamidase
MKARIEHQGTSFTVDLSKPIDISIALSPNGPRAWYVEPMTIEPVKSEAFMGSVKEGGSVNFNNVFFNPHGHGTHTESFGHIAEEVVSVNKVLREFFFIAELISITPEQVVEESEWRKRGDNIITLQQVEEALAGKQAEAVIIRTLPNTPDKRTKNYSATNFTYIEHEALAWLAEQGIRHLLVDLPSVDREHDGGLLKAHHAFWNYPQATREFATITEFVFINDEVKDGSYFLNLQVAAIENDAAPSRPVIFAIES